MKKMISLFVAGLILGLVSLTATAGTTYIPLPDSRGVQDHKVNISEYIDGWEKLHPEVTVVSTAPLWTFSNAWGVQYWGYYITYRGILGHQNAASTRHVPVFKEWHANSLWFYFKPKEDTQDVPIVYHDPSIHIVSVSASKTTESAHFIYCLTFRVGSTEDCETTIFDPREAVSSIRWQSLDAETLQGLAKALK
jgi:hypothetical protein